MHQKPKKLNFTGLFKRPQLLNLDELSYESGNLDTSKNDTSINISRTLSIQIENDSQINEPQNQTKKANLNINSKSNRVILKQLVCSRCDREKAMKKCRFCGSAQYCLQCDQSVHMVGKFSLHSREQIKKEQEQKDENLNTGSDLHESGITIKVSEAKEVERVNNMKKTLTTVNISQVWRQVIKNLQTHFDQLLEELQNKKNQIIKKVKSRQEQEINKYNQSITQHQKLIEESSASVNYMKKSAFREKIQQVQSKIMEIQNQYKIDQINKENRYTVVGNYFDELQAAIKKIHLKNILSKNVFQSELLIGKSKIKSSLQSATNISANLSPSYKTPKNQTKLGHRFSNFSGGGIEQELPKPNKYILDRPNEQQSTITSKKAHNLSKNQIQLCKVRSQKLFPKSPILGSPKSAYGKISEYFNSNKRNTKKINS